MYSCSVYFVYSSTYVHTNHALHERLLRLILTIRHAGFTRCLWAVTREPGTATLL